ncbi:aminoglycoside phosphotransferase family protein [Streptomyces sp. NPDC088124]|uniref:phosphotransferase family protein n=1 Tax=Streptomyces sp. NPDC088124 TaxID=3154654 RepID=UPI00343CAF9E
MHNLHKRRPGKQQFHRMLAAAGVDPGLVRSRTELEDATFNTVYRVRLSEDAPGYSGLVLKIAPDPAMPTLSYERGIMRTEGLFYAAAAGRAPVPEVVYADFSRELIDTDFLVLTDLPGANWSAARERIGDDERAGLRGELGGLVAALHEVTGPAFGYPQTAQLPEAARVLRTAGAPGAASVASPPGWRAAFLAMVDTVLADAATFGAPLPEPAERIRETVHAAADPLDAVTTPVLVHFDLWDGNILVDRAAPDEPHRISGLIDGERAFWGDPLAELVSLALFEDIERDGAFLDGYRSAGGRVDFDAETRRRLGLYRCYLYLIMLVEVVPRGFSGPEQEARDRHVSGLLRAELAALGRAGAAGP